VSRAAALALISAVLVACGGSAVASVTPTPSPTTASATAVPAATTRPTPSASLTPAQVAAAHITKNVTYLMSISDPHVILAWIDSENTWVKGQTLPVLSDYSATVQAAAILLKDGGKQNVINDKAVDIIDAARQVPGVTLP
jgi:hypothetical protein